MAKSDSEVGTDTDLPDPDPGWYVIKRFHDDPAHVVAGPTDRESAKTIASFAPDPNAKIMHTPALVNAILNHEYSVEWIGNVEKPETLKDDDPMPPVPEDPPQPYRDVEDGKHECEYCGGRANSTVGGEHVWRCSEIVPKDYPPTGTADRVPLAAAYEGTDLMAVAYHRRTVELLQKETPWVVVATPEGEEVMEGAGDV